MDNFMDPFYQLDLEEVVCFAKFRFSEEVVNRPSDDCKKCMNECNNNSMCYKQSYDACATNPPPDGDVEKCAWNDLVFNNVYTQCSGCVDNCSDSCKSNKADPEAIGILTRWLPSENDTDGSQKMDELNTYIRDINQLIWDGKCFNTDGTPKFDENGNKMSDSIPGPDALPPEEKLVVEQVDTTVAFIHAEAAAMTPKIVEPVRICKFIRFDGLQERPAVYGEVFNMNLIMQGKAREAFTDATIDESKLVAGIDTRDQINRAYAGAINKSTNETAMFASFAINSGDNFGLELWKQMMLGFVRPDKKN